jgi:hypothetical protein
MPKKKKLKKIMPDEEKGEMIHSKKIPMRMQVEEEANESYSPAAKRELMKMLMKKKKK